ncbi:ABC transporter ATP-binding protein [Microbacterium faecale]|uniref:ABC transporter ATP-binding protein n=1 Tax=Microbacterium faecale TaxID=1804630 RepID=A0A916Y4D1_9MICO|nr:ABC transporter ATP-binding protein [Microbacterium faecale]GGD29211.1 ABC transporter ATP-binding protein [Microbacterium faecale]
MRVELAGVTKSFGKSQVLHGIDLTIADGEFVTLLGPSGCGKTTTLRCIAGLEDPDGGSIDAGDRTFANADSLRFLPPHRRKVGMVFQSYALWPHLSVTANVAYPMKRRKVPRGEIRQRAAQALASVDMAKHADRFPHELSGGQQQRVALARGLVSANGLMLYDEPLSNLDAKLRIAMRAEIQRLHREFGNTSIYVTHDQEEALALSDRVVIMNSGRIDQVGTPEEIYGRPVSRFAADFVGFENIVGADGSALAGGLRATDRSLTAPAGGALAFRSKSVRLGDTTGGLVGRGVIRDSAYVGEYWTARVEAADGTSIGVTMAADHDRRMTDGTETEFSVRSDDVIALQR